MSDFGKLRSTIKYPTSLIIRGADVVGVELAKSLLEQGGFVIVVDHRSDFSEFMVRMLSKYELFAFFDFTEIHKVEEFLRRLDYVFYLSHEVNDFSTTVSSQDFLEFSKFLDSVLALAVKYEAKFLATTSVKGHQYLLDKKDIDLNYKINSELHTVYSEAELQRYIESLTVEYVDKSSLDGRILRLGSVIGEGIELGTDNTIGRLVQESIKSDNLTIYGDGLENEYYLHLLDAVYGIIKCQFSKNTRGEVYTLAYEHPISTLSIAYKINEFASQPKEIVFTGESPAPLSLVLYKPASNLMQIGWKPRISFERALKQCYDYNKQLLLKSGTNDTQSSEEKSIETSKPVAKKTQKKRGFFEWLFFADNSKSDQNEVETSESGEQTSNTEEFGALGRLIAERKIQETGRKGSILIANEYLLKRLKKEDTSAYSRGINSITKAFDRFTSKFDGLRYMTLRQFIGLATLGVLGVLLYFYLISPLLSLGRNLVAIYTLNEEFLINVNEKKYLEASLKVESMSIELAEVRSKVQYYYPVLKDFELYRKIDQDLASLSYSVALAYEGLHDEYVGTSSAVKYMSSFKANIIYRPSSASILTIDGKQNYSDLLADIDGRVLISEGGANKLNISLQKLSAVDAAFYGVNIKKSIDEMIKGVNALNNEFTTYGKISKVLPLLVSSNTQKTYALLLVDNTQYLPAGGAPINIIIVTTENGAISDIKTKIITTSSLALNEPDKYLIEDINLTHSILKDESSVNFNDLFYLQNSDVYFEQMQRAISKSEGKKVDGIFLYNLNFLAGMLDITGKQEIDNVSYDGQNLIQNLNFSSQQKPDKTAYRKEVLNNLSALVFQNALNNVGGKVVDLALLTEKSASRKDVLYHSFFSNTSEIYTKVNVNDNIIEESPDYISVLAVSDNDATEDRQIPSIKLKINATIKADLSSRKNVSVDYSGLKGLDVISVCVPSGSSNFLFTDESSIDKVQRISETQVCINVKSTTKQSFSFAYDTISKSNYSSGVYNYTYGIRKQPGLDLDTDIEFEFVGTQPVKFSEGGVEQSKGIAYLGKMESDKLIGLTLR